MAGRLKQLAERLYRRRLRNAMLRTQVCIISNDCWGGQPYKYAGVEYNTPFVGLFLTAPCYIKLLNKLEDHIKRNHLEFVPISKYDFINAYRNKNNLNYPIGLLNGEIEIQFLHYPSEADAFEKWNKRAQRMNFSNLAVKFDGSKDLAGPDECTKFSQMPFTKKILLNNFENKTGLSCEIISPEWQSDGAKMFRYSLKLFDFNTWIQTGNLVSNPFQLLCYKHIIAHTKNLL